MSNSGWAVVVVVALVIVAIFGYWAIDGRDAGVDRDGTARIESDVNVERQPSAGGGGSAEVNINREQPAGSGSGGNAEVDNDREPPARSGGNVDVEIREQGSAEGNEPAR